MASHCPAIQKRRSYITEQILYSYLSPLSPFLFYLYPEENRASIPSLTSSVSYKATQLYNIVRRKPKDASTVLFLPTFLFYQEMFILFPFPPRTKLFNVLFTILKQKKKSAYMPVWMVQFVNFLLSLL